MLLRDESVVGHADRHSRVSRLPLVIVDVAYDEGLRLDRAIHARACRRETAERHIAHELCRRHDRIVLEEERRTTSREAERHPHCQQ